MNQKIPPDAFSYYWSLGTDRSYKAVADKYGVTKKAVTKLAMREKWQERATEIALKAKEATDKKLVESLEDMSERHIKVCKLIQGKAIEALKTMPLASAMDSVRALDLAIKQERLIRGEPTDRSVLAVEDVIKREYDSWLVNTYQEDKGDIDDKDTDQTAE